MLPASERDPVTIDLRPIHCWKGFAPYLQSLGTAGTNSFCNLIFWLKQDHHRSQSGPIIGVGERIGTDLEIQFALLDCDSHSHCCVLLSQ